MKLLIDIPDSIYDISKYVDSSEVKPESLFLTNLLELIAKGKVQDWIPCSERLPEEKYTGGTYQELCPNPSDYVLVQLNNGAMAISRYWSRTPCFGKSEWVDLEYGKPIAWMPLPYKYEEPKIKSNDRKVTGHWKLIHPLQEDGGGSLICSICKSGSCEVTEDYKFCPWCGNPMDGLERKSDLDESVLTGNDRLDIEIETSINSGLNIVALDEEYNSSLYAYVMKNWKLLESKGYELEYKDGFFGYGRALIIFDNALKWRFVDERKAES